MVTVRRMAFVSVLLLLATVASPLAAQEAHHASTLGQELSLASIVPFALLLLSIAFFPLFWGHWWEDNRNKAIVSVLLSLPIVVFLVFVWGTEGAWVLGEELMEYVSFIILLAALFVISGGIYVRGSLSGTPLANTTFLAIGAVLANLIGTTGASVLLIRPLLRANWSRERKAHIVIFFIFVVSNCAGLLTPIGDPPLFLGFLKGVPFTWTLRLWPQWLLVNGMLLLVFSVWDQVVFYREEAERAGSQLEDVMLHEPFRMHGLHNFVLLGGVVGTVVASGQGFWNGGEPWPFGVREALMAGLTIAAYLVTAEANRRNNRFTFGPIIEVAVLFLGIFITMTPALQILNAWGHGQREVFGMAFNLTQPWHFFWATGGLSSFLDNAPTYLTLSATAAGLEHVPATGRFLAVFLEQGTRAAGVLTAISCGAVFMGANTYIGNGPNFMVKAIAEENGIEMPGFFRYMFYSAAVLLPIFLFVTIVFFGTQ
jgi:Na+/H+ antiporter NhaD/arsenite permease-like protein